MAEAGARTGYTSAGGDAGWALAALVAGISVVAGVIEQADAGGRAWLVLIGAVVGLVPLSALVGRYYRLRNRVSGARWADRAWMAALVAAAVVGGIAAIAG